MIGFGAFEVDLTAGELRKNGLKIRLQEQPLRVLALLLERPGEVVSRDEIRERLWSSDTFVEFEHSLNTAVNRLRAALGDSADHPRYVETVPRRGYRFIGTVDFGNPPEAAPGAVALASDGDASLAVLSSEPAAETSAIPASRETVATRRRYLPWLLFVLTALALTGVLYLRQTPPEAPLRRFAVPLPITPRLANMPSMLAISPDGKHIAFAEGTPEGKLWLHDLERSESRPLDDTEFALAPFWSPDSLFIGFATNRELKRVAMQGGQVFRLCELPRKDPPSVAARWSGGSFGGGSWSPDGETVAFASGGVIYHVPVLGGIAEPLITAETQAPSAEKIWGSLTIPHFLPSKTGRRLLAFTYGFGPRKSLVIQDLDSDRWELLGPGFMPFFSATGHLVYQPHAHSRTLLALPFSPDTLKPTGKAFPIANDGNYPSIAADGTLVYLEWAVAEEKQLVWIDRQGKRLGQIGPVKRHLRDPALSPDGQRVAVSVQADESNQDVWVYDTVRGSAWPVTTVVDNDFCPAWSPSGEHLAFSSNRAGRPDIFLQRADGTGAAEPLLSTPGNDILMDWSRDGEYLLFQVGGLQEKADIWRLKRNEDSDKWGEPQPFLQTPFYEGDPKLSPDNHYVAYVSDLSGELEVYVESFPEGGGKQTISRNGGIQPRWSHDGTELFYVEGDMLMAVSVSTTPSFSVGPATALFRHPTLQDHTPYPQYDVSNDGQKFILAEPVSEFPAPKIRVVQNWFSEFRGRQ